MHIFKKSIIWPDNYVDYSALSPRVIVRFIIDETGKIICPKIQRALDPSIDKEALRIISILPDWIPASNDEGPIKACYTLPVLFRYH